MSTQVFLSGYLLTFQLTLYISYPVEPTKKGETTEELMITPLFNDLFAASKVRGEAPLKPPT